jgi:hypothetical protein
VTNNSIASVHERLIRFVIEAMSRTPLDALEKATGIHKTQLSKMRHRKRSMSFEEADAILAACGCHRRALLLLCCIGADNPIAAQSMAFIERFLDGFPTVVTLLEDDPHLVNPTWGASSVSHLVPLLSMCFERAREREDTDCFARAVLSYGRGASA